MQYTQTNNKSKYTDRWSKYFKQEVRNQEEERKTSYFLFWKRE